MAFGNRCHRQRHREQRLHHASSFWPPKASPVCPVSSQDYRHDLAWEVRATVFPGMLENPHTFSSVLANFGPIAVKAQACAAQFFASGMDPQPSAFFEFPIVGPLPEDLNFIK